LRSSPITLLVSSQFIIASPILIVRSQ
jgi:hypothetical protein